MGMTRVFAIALQPAWRRLAIAVAVVELTYFASVSFIMIGFGESMAAFDGRAISTYARVAAYTLAGVIAAFLALGVLVLARPNRYSRKLSSWILTAMAGVHAIAFALLMASLVAALVGIARGFVGYDSIVWHSGLIAMAIVVGVCATANVVRLER